MADTKITSLLTPQVTTNPATDVLPIVNIADTSMASSGSTRKITVNTLLGSGGTATLASATITGDLTVDTNVLKVDSSNDRVGLGIAAPAYRLHVQGTASLQLVLQSNDTNANAKEGTVNVRHYTNAEEPVSAVGGFTTSTANEVYLGGGFSAGNAATLLGFYTAANNTTTIGTERYRIAGDGVATWSNVGGTSGTAMTLNSTGLGVGGSPSFKLDVNGDIGVSGNENYVYLFSTYSIGNNSRVRFRAVGAGGGSGYGGDFRISTRASNNSWNTDAMTLDASGNLILLSSNTPATLTTNGQLTVNATSNTNLRFSYRGSDGVTRTANLTLA